MFIRILSLYRRPASSWLQPMSTSPRIPIIVDILSHPLFRLSSIVSLFPPKVDTTFPTYFVDSQLVKGLWCTFSCGLFTYTTTDFSADNFSRCVSTNTFMATFFCIEAVPHCDTPRVSSIKPRTPISIFGCPL